MGIWDSSKTLVFIYQTTRRPIPQDRSICAHGNENDQQVKECKSWPYIILVRPILHGYIIDWYVLLWVDAFHIAVSRVNEIGTGRPWFDSRQGRNCSFAHHIQPRIPLYPCDLLFDIHFTVILSSVPFTFLDRNVVHVSHLPLARHVSCPSPVVTWPALPVCTFAYGSLCSPNLHISTYTQQPICQPVIP
jgi:hypothetical protein